MKTTWLLGLLLTSATACASTTSMGSNSAAVFDRYRTFSVSVADPALPTTDLEQRLGPMITDALQRKGYVATQGHADLAITVGAARRHETVKKETTEAPEPDGEHVVANADVVESSIAIDAFDAATKARVWHGIDRVHINGNVVDQQQVWLAVDRLLGSFPTAPIQRPDTAPIQQASNN